MEEVEEQRESPPAEAEMAKDASKTITEEVLEFQEHKKEVEEQNKEESKKKAKPKRNIDLTKLNEFKDKIKKEFALTEEVDSNGCPVLYYKDTTPYILKLLPRKNCWYGVYREVPEEDNKRRAFRVNSEQDEKKHYDFIEKIITVNNKENE